MRTKQSPAELWNLSQPVACSASQLIPNICLKLKGRDVLTGEKTTKPSSARLCNLSRTHMTLGERKFSVWKSLTLANYRRAGQQWLFLHRWKTCDLFHRERAKNNEKLWFNSYNAAFPSKTSSKTALWLQLIRACERPTRTSEIILYHGQRVPYLHIYHL